MKKEEEEKKKIHDERIPKTKKSVFSMRELVTEMVIRKQKLWLNLMPSGIYDVLVCMEDYRIVW